MYKIQCVSLSVSMNKIENWTNCYALVLVQKCYKVWMRHNKIAEIKNCVFSKSQSTLTSSQNGKRVELFCRKFCWRTKIINFLNFVCWQFVCLQECYCFCPFFGSNVFDATFFGDFDTHKIYEFYKFCVQCILLLTVTKFIFFNKFWFWTNLLGYIKNCWLVLLLHKIYKIYKFWLCFLLY